MGECICSSCVNLKGIMNDKGAIDVYECEYGFPSDTCSECESGECELTCNHYLCDDENEQPVIIKCKGCGRELKQVCSDGGDGDAYCFDCYLKINGT